jgi:hypothetical protein
MSGRTNQYETGAAALQPLSQRHLRVLEMNDWSELIENLWAGAFFRQHFTILSNV